MRWRFNYQIYDLKPHADAPTPAAAQGYRAEEEEEQINYDMIQVMQDIDEIFGEPIFITDWSIHYYSVLIKEISIFIAKYNNIVIYYAKSAYLGRLFQPYSTNLISSY